MLFIPLRPYIFKKMRKMKTRCSLVLFFLLFTLTIATPQYQEVYSLKGPFDHMVQKKPVAFRAFPVWEDSLRFRLYLLVEIQYDYLLFIIHEGKFTASAEIEVIFKEKDDEHGFTRLWQTSVQTSTFDSTNLKYLYHLTIDTLTVPPGNYTVYFRYTDINGALQFKITQKMNLQVNQAVFISGPVLLYRNTPPPTGFANFPEAPSAFGQHWDFNRDVSFFFHFKSAPDNPLHYFQLRIRNKETQQTELAVDTTWSHPPQATFLSIPMATHLLAEGKYEVQTVWKFREQTVKKTYPFRIIWFDKPFSLWDIRRAIKPLRYVMDTAEYLTFRDAPLPLLEHRFKQFWAERDPTPGTPFNEAMAEFYRRVDIANRQWSNGGEEGWETDIGKIFILYGEPDLIEDHSLDPEGQPYLKWIYFIDDRKVEVTFISIEGRKAYRLEKLEEIPNEDSG